MQDDVRELIEAVPEVKYQLINSNLRIGKNEAAQSLLDGMSSALTRLSSELEAKDERIGELEALNKRRREGDPLKKEWCLCGVGMKASGTGDKNPHSWHCQAYYKPNHPDLIELRQYLSQSEGKS